MNIFFLSVWLFSSVSDASPAAMGPLPDVLDTAGSVDTGLQNQLLFGRTPAEHCSTQTLRGGMRLPDRPELYRYWNGVTAWGTAEMLHAITTASAEMAWLMPHADPLVIGDISRRYGGKLSSHKSHRGGMDADIGIFTTGGSQPDGGGFTGVTPQTMDYEANWLFWRSLLETGLVDRILLDQRLIDAMRAWTIEQGELSEADAYRTFPPAGTPRLWAYTSVFQHAINHHHHIHLRVLCGDDLEQVN